MAGVAKGLASGAAAFLASLVLAVVKDEVANQVPTVDLLGAFAGALGLLITAACVSRQLAQKVRSAALQVPPDVGQTT